MLLLNPRHPFIFGPNSSSNTNQNSFPSYLYLFTLPICLFLVLMLQYNYDINVYATLYGSSLWKMEKLSFQAHFQIYMRKPCVKVKLCSNSNNYYSKLHHLAWVRFEFAIQFFYQSKCILTLTLKLPLSDYS